MFNLFFNGMAAFQQAGMLLAGALCFAIGALIFGNGMYWRLKATRVNGITFAMLGGIVAVGAFRFKKYIIPKEQRLSVSDWRAARESEHAQELAKTPVQPIEEFRASPDGIKAVAQERQQARLAVPIL